MLTPSRLTLARLRRGLSKAKLAKLARVTPLTITRYESGETQPSPTMLLSLANLLGFPPSFFEGDDLDVPSVEAVSFRALSKMTASQRDLALSAGAMAIALSNYLEDHFDLPESKVPILDRGIADASTAADMVRSSWGLGNKPLPNIIHLLESRGVRVFSLIEECRELDAFSFWHRGVPFICLNTMKTAEHSRLDAAHELGHLVLHRDHSRPSGRPEEQEAHLFASTFLMPTADVLAHARRFPAFNDLVTSKRRWGVSVAALAFRLHRMGLITDWHYRELCIEISRYGRMREPNPIQPELSQLLAKTMGALHSEGKGRMTISKDLGWHPEDLDSLVFGLAVSALEGAGEAAPHHRKAQLRLLAN